MTTRTVVVATMAVAVAVCSVQRAAAMAVVSRAIRHPAGKISLFPEIRPDVQKPAAAGGGDVQANALWQLVAATTDPTAGASDLSKTMREGCNPACVVVSDDLDVLKAVVAEQQESLGQFPGPCPVVFCAAPEGEAAVDYAAVKDAGAAAVVVAVETTDDLAAAVDAAGAADLELVPELKADSGDLVKAMLEAAQAMLPAKSAVLVHPDALELAEGDPLLGRPSPLSLLANVQVVPGQGELVPTVRELQRLKFHGAFLRSTCLPRGLRRDLGKQGKYWEGAVAAIRSARSTTYAFRSKTEAVPAEMQAWVDYAESVTDYMGAEDWDEPGVGDVGPAGGGEPGMDGEDDFDSERGDWVGF